MAAPHPSLLRLIQEGVFPSDVRVTMPIVDSAAEHGVAPLLDDAIRRNGPDGDHEALVALTMCSLESTAATTAAIGAVVGLLDRADTLGIELAVFKGLAIGTRWYSRPELRPAVDVDVFVNPHQSDRLGEFVEAFAPEAGRRATVESMVAEGRVFEYPLEVGGVAIDVHLDPMNFVVPMRQRHVMWQHTELIPTVGGRTLRVLDLEMSILQALSHLFRDNFADLLHIHDVGLMIDNDPDWEFIATIAAAEGWTDLIRFSLGFVCDVLERPSPLPRDISDSGRALISAIWPERILLKGSASLARSDRRQSLASLLITGRRLDVARAMQRRVLPPRTVIDDRFPGDNGRYLAALYRWRRAQRSEILQFRSIASHAVAPNPRDLDGGPTVKAPHD